MKINLKQLLLLEVTDFIKKFNDNRKRRRKKIIIFCYLAKCQQLNNLFHFILGEE
jgi:hypothetical protein